MFPPRTFEHNWFVFKRSGPIAKTKTISLSQLTIESPQKLQHHLSSNFQPSDGGGDAGGGKHHGGDEDDDRGRQHLPHWVPRPSQDGWCKEEKVQVKKIKQNQCNH